jgi:hypothetical protein
MTALEIKTLPIEEKVRLMEAIWEDMRDHCEEAPVSQEVVDLLKARQARVERGEACLLEWDEVELPS